MVHPVSFQPSTPRIAHSSLKQTLNFSSLLVTRCFPDTLSAIWLLLWYIELPSVLVITPFVWSYIHSGELLLDGQTVEYTHPTSTGHLPTARPTQPAIPPKRVACSFFSKLYSISHSSDQLRPKDPSYILPHQAGLIKRKISASRSKRRSPSFFDGPMGGVNIWQISTYSNSGWPKKIKKKFARTPKCPRDPRQIGKKHGVVQIKGAIVRSSRRRILSTIIRASTGRRWRISGGWKN